LQHTWNITHGNEEHLDFVEKYKKAVINLGQMQPTPKPFSLAFFLEGPSLFSVHPSGMGILAPAKLWILINLATCGFLIPLTNS
jgi:hypothetical protein